MLGKSAQLNASLPSEQFWRWGCATGRCGYVVRSVPPAALFALIDSGSRLAALELHADVPHLNGNFCMDDEMAAFRM